MRRYLSLLLAVVMIAAAFSSVAVRAEYYYGECGDGIMWLLLVSDRTLTINLLDPESSGVMTSSDWKDYWDCIETVNIDYGVTTISEWAFSGCENLMSITIPDSVTGIGYGAFSYCQNLASITIPSDVYIDEYAFKNCKSLTSISIPENAVIAEQAFDGCIGLTSITVDINNPNYYSQNDCIIERDSKKLILGCKASAIPSDVTSIGNGAFAGCTGLTSITIPDSVRSIGNYAFSDCTGLTSITIPDGVTSIGYNAFDGCRNLTSATIPNGVTSIGSSAFEYCSGLTSIIIPNGVRSIGWDAFYNCESLTSVTIPDSVTNIGSSAFRGCTGLASVYYRGSESDWGNISIGSSNTNLTSATRYYNSCIGSASHTFSDVWSTDAASHWHVCTVCGDITDSAAHVYDDAFDTTCNVCGYVRAIPTVVTGEAGDDVTWSYNVTSGALVISGEGDSYDFSSGEAPWASVAESVTTVSIGKTVTALGENLFENCSNLSEVTVFGAPDLPAGLFDDCPDVTVKGFSGSGVDFYCASAGVAFESLEEFEGIGYQIANVEKNKFRFIAQMRYAEYYTTAGYEVHAYGSNGGSVFDKYLDRTITKVYASISGTNALGVEGVVATAAEGCFLSAISFSGLPVITGSGSIRFDVTPYVKNEYSNEKIYGETISLIYDASGVKQYVPSAITTVDGAGTGEEIDYGSWT